MTAPLTDGHLDEIEARLAASRKTYGIDVWEETTSPHFEPPGWTWCKVVNGDPRDLVFDLPHCADEATARREAQSWLDGVLAQDPSDADVLLAEVRRLRAENEQLADLDAAASRRTELQAERDRAVARWHDERKRAEKAEAERDDLRERIGNARTEIAAQSAAHHVAACGSPVGSVVEQALDAVEAHLVDPQYRLGAAPGGVEHSAENPPKSDYSSTTFERAEP